MMGLLTQIVYKAINGLVFVLKSFFESLLTFIQVAAMLIVDSLAQAWGEWWQQARLSLSAMADWLGGFLVDLVMAVGSAVLSAANEAGIDVDLTQLQGWLDDGVQWLEPVAWILPINAMIQIVAAALAAALAIYVLRLVRSLIPFA